MESYFNRSDLRNNWPVRTGSGSTDDRTLPDSNTAEETLIGRNPTTDVTLLDENISREHALILFDADADAYTIEDLQSTNGTKVNGKGVRSHALQPGDEIQVGHTRFQFVRT